MRPPASQATQPSAARAASGQAIAAQPASVMNSRRFIASLKAPGANVRQSKHETVTGEIGQWLISAAED